MTRPRGIADEQLLTAAGPILLEAGPAGFTLEKSASRAGVSAATLIKRFGSKQQLCLGLIIGPARATPGRRAAGAVIAGGYLLAVLANFAYLYPILAARAIPYSSWLARIWFRSWI